MTQMQKRARSLVSCISSSSAHIHARSTDAHIHAEAVTSVHIPSEASMQNGRFSEPVRTAK
jgi:hypothetical protein